MCTVHLTAVWSWQPVDLWTAQSHATRMQRTVLHSRTAWPVARLTDVMERANQGKRSADGKRKREREREREREEKSARTRETHTQDEGECGGYAHQISTLPRNWSGRVETHPAMLVREQCCSRGWGGVDCRILPLRSCNQQPAATTPWPKCEYAAAYFFSGEIFITVGDTALQTNKQTT